MTVISSAVLAFFVMVIVVNAIWNFFDQIEQYNRDRILIKKLTEINEMLVGLSNKFKGDGK